MASTKVSIIEHTTASNPRPHILYFLDVEKADGETLRVAKRYSDVSLVKHVADNLKSSLGARSS